MPTIRWINPDTVEITPQPATSPLKQSAVRIQLLLPTVFSGITLSESLLMRLALLIERTYPFAVIACCATCSYLERECLHVVDRSGQGLGDKIAQDLILKTGNCECGCARGPLRLVERLIHQAAATTTIGVACEGKPTNGNEIATRL